jgi:PAS domain-containing protein
MKKDLYSKWDQLTYRNWLVILIPLAYAVIFLWIDSIISGAPVTPLFAVIGVFLMAFFFRPYAMIIWATVYCVLITAVFFDPIVWKVVSTQEYGADKITPFVRTLGFFITSGVACILNNVLNRLRLNNLEMDEILDLLPDLIITSDVNGSLHYVNKAAAANLRLNKSKDRIPSYFDLLAPKDKQGSTIAQYLKRIDAHAIDVKKPLSLKIGEKKVDAYTRVINSKKPKLLMSVISHTDYDPACLNNPLS